MSNTHEVIPATSFIAGISHNQYKENAVTLLQKARIDGFDYCTTLLPNFITASDAKIRTDITAMESKWWSSCVVGEVDCYNNNDNLMMSDSSSPSTSNENAHLIEMPQGQEILKNNIEWASHMNIPAVIVPALPNEKSQLFRYAQLLTSLAYLYHQVQFWIRTDLSAQALKSYDFFSRFCTASDLSNVGILLCLDSAKTQNIAQDSISGLLHYFIGYNIKALCFDTSMFLTNARGYPTLSKAYQAIVTHLFKRIGRTVRVLIESKSHGNLAGKHTLDGETNTVTHLQYLRHLRNSKAEITQVLDSEEAKQETPYLDHLQNPLQPLGDHLEYGTYEVFEKDPVKYFQYEKAIRACVFDMLHSGTLKSNQQESSNSSSSMQEDEKEQHYEVVVMVAGAGRGPLMMCALQAIESLVTSKNNLKFKLVGVEKNPSAVLFLESKFHSQSNVLIVKEDMREIHKNAKLLDFLQNQKIHVLVSELLGSFGDNELSPECLHGVYEYSRNILHPNIVSIPTSYTSYLAPVSSVKLHNEARLQSYFPIDQSHGNASGSIFGIQRALETPYVVRTHAASQIFIEQPCFSFVHSLTDNLEFQQFAMCSFDPNDKSTGCGCGYGAFDLNSASSIGSNNGISIHGLLGTFDATLYTPQSFSDESIHISIAPSSFSKGMFSWFPLYFPLKETLYIPKDASFKSYFWRKTDEHRVWYEWSAEVIEKREGEEECISCTSMHNSNGRSYFVKL